MKKIFRFLVPMFVFLVVFGVSTIGAQVITVDGVKDAFFETLTGPDDGYVQLQAFHNEPNMMPNGNADLSAKVWGAWDDTWFYLYAEVTDEIVACPNTAAFFRNDCIELKVDGQPTDSTQSGAPPGGISLTATLTALDSADAPVGAVTANLETLDDADKQYARGDLVGGYTLELAIALDTLGGSEKITAAVGEVFGLGFHFVDNDGSLPSSNRTAAITWAAVCDDHIWNTPKYHGTVEFLADNKLKFIPTNNMTGYGHGLPYDGSVPMVVVDGELDPLYKTLSGPDEGYLQLKSYAFNDNGIPHGDEDLSSKMWFAWDDDNLYMYNEVVDDTISASSANSYQNDGWEIKVDPEPTDSVANSIVGHVQMTALDTTGGETGIDGIEGAVRKITADGYVIEAAIPWTEFVSGAEVVDVGVGNVFGCATHNHDNDNATGARDASVAWAAVLLDHVWDTPKYLGTVEFLADNKLKFMPSNNMTGVTNDVPYDGTPIHMRMDGEMDPFYYTLKGPDEGYLQLRSYAWNDNGIPDDDDDLSSKMWFAWDENNLYMYNEVVDDTVSMSSANNYQNDSWEIKVDPQPTDSVTNSIVGVDFTALDTTGGITGVATPATSFRKTTADGYVLECAIPWTDLATTTESVDVGVGNVFGCATHNHDNDNTTGARDASVAWAAVLLDHVWDTPKYLGRVEFLADNKLEFDPTNNMTGVTNEIPYDGSDYIRVGVEDIAVEVPLRFNLAQNYPNPFNPTTKISYEIPSNTKVRLIVYDVLGREVARLVDEVKKPGTHEVAFDGKKFSSGVYFYKLETDSRTQVKKMMILK